MELARRFLLYSILVFLIISLSKNILEYRRNINFYNDYQEQFNKEKKRNIELKTKLIKVKDVEEFEKTVRNKLNLQKPNETILVIPNPTPTLFVPTSTPVPNYRQWANVFSQGS